MSWTSPSCVGTSSAAALGAWCLLVLSAGSAAAQTPEPPPPVVAAPVVERMVAAEQTFVGTVKPRRMSIVGSAVDGRVIEFFVNEGDAVTSGQPLAQLRTGTLEIELAGARAELELRQQELAELVNGSRPEEIAQAKASMLRAQGLAAYARDRHQRNATLYQRSQAVTEDELERTRSLMIETEQAYQEAQAAYELAVKGPRAEKIDRAKAYVAVQAETVRHIEDRLEKHTIRAPFNGYVVREGTEQGQWINQAEVVAEVAELDPVEVEVHIPEAYINHLALGMEAVVKVESLGDRIFTGRVTRLVPQADPRTRTFPVKLEVANPQQTDMPALKAGMLARVGLPVAPQQRAMLVPKDALVLGGASPSLRVIDTPSAGAKIGTIRVVPVQIGVADGGWIQVEGDVRPGQRVVVKGNERVQPDQKVTIVQEIAAN